MTDLAYGQSNYTQPAAPEPVGYGGSWGQNYDAPATDDTPSDVADHDTGQDSAHLQVVESPDEANEDDGREGDEEVSAAPTTKGRSGAKKGPDRSLIRRVASKTVELSDAPEGHRSALAALLGAREEIVALTTAVMTADRAALSPLTSLTQVLDAEGELQQAITVMGLASEGKLKDVWSVLTSFGVVDGALPTNDRKATEYVVEKLRDIDAGQLRSDIAAVNTLAKRW